MISILVARIAFSSDEISIQEDSSRMFLFVNLSLFILVSKYFSCCFEFFEIYSLAIYNLADYIELSIIYDKWSCTGPQQIR